MKTILLLGLFMTVAAQAACDYGKTENVTCEMNYHCAEKALRAGEEVDAYTNWSKAHNCQDELKFASLFASFDGEPQQTVYTAKIDLPAIPDAPERAPAQIKEK